MLVVAFNRPAIAARLVDQLRLVQPDRVFVAADGPRDGLPSDVDLCERTRAQFDRIDWPCDVSRRFQDRNQGLQVSMVGAIDWFFAEVPSGIVLEDDCLPHPDFFGFAGDLLERYADVTQMMSVASLNLAPDEDFGPHSYHFASAGHIWGWATWRRAWRGFDVDLVDWPVMRREFGRGAPPLRRALRHKFDAAHAGRKHTWARAWHYHVARHHGLVAVPSVNLMRNVGFGADATHTTSPGHPLAELPVGRLRFPLDHPHHLLPSARYDARLARFHTWPVRRRVNEWWRRRGTRYLR